MHLLQELSCPQVHLFIWCEPSLAPLYRLSRVEQEAGRLDEGEHGGWVHALVPTWGCTPLARCSTGYSGRGSPQQLFLGHASSVPSLIGQCSSAKKGRVQQCVYIMIRDVISGVIQCTLHLCIRGSLPFTQATVTCVCDDPYHFNISIVCVHSQRKLLNLMYHWTSVSHYMWCV